MANTHPVALSELVTLVERLPDATEEERLRITLPPPPPSESVVVEGAVTEHRHTEFHRTGDGDGWLFRGDVVLDGACADHGEDPALAHMIRERLGPRCEEVEVASVAGQRATVRVLLAGDAVGSDEG